MRHKPRMRFIFSALCALALVQSALADLPESANHRELSEFMRKLDLGSPDVELEPNRSGTSAYVKVKVEGKVIGAVVPEASATSIAGEVASYQLARVLGVEENSSPAAYYLLDGRGMERVRAIMAKEKYSSSHKEANRKTLLARIAKSPRGFLTVYKAWGERPYDCNAIEPIAKLIRSNGPRPSERLVSLAGVPGTAPERELARQLSSLYLIDALMGQWDRFSGGNLQAYSSDGRVRFAFLDNGGTWGSVGWVKRYLKQVSRFDARVSGEILEMDRFVAGKSAVYRGFTRETELAKALGLDVPPAKWKDFKRNLRLVAAHIGSTARANPLGAYFD